jgi:hypothetical protein
MVLHYTIQPQNPPAIYQSKKTVQYGKDVYYVHTSLKISSKALCKMS